jgi:peptidyl-prolyl cis-trans isomerase B (cyclophilin B)
MRKITKAASVVATFVIFAAGFSTIASAVEPSVKVMCNETSAVAHREKRVSIPKVSKSSKSKIITLNTNCGKIVIEANSKNAPITTSMLVGLIKSGFYDMSICHRMISSGTASLLQCGDPTASGFGGPPFTFKDENLPSQAENNYPVGSVAMANPGSKNQNGSQFFIMANDTTLDPEYSIWGKVISGLEIVKAIVNNGTEENKPVGKPRTKIAIEKATVR